MDAKPPLETDAASPNALPRKLRILIADDNRDAVLTLGMLLREEGHEVRNAYNGTEALAAARHLSFDAVILDIEMPDLSGYAIAQELRKAYYATRGPLLIAISGKWNKDSEKLLSHAVGFDHHLTKPCTPAQLFQILRPLTLPRAREQGPG